MNALIAIALKSLLVAGLTLLVLRLVRGRSAAERSWVAHVGLFALVVLPFAPLAIPILPIETAAVGQPPTPISTPALPNPLTASAEPASVATTGPSDTAVVGDSWTALDIASFLYWIPAALLLGITLLALVRLVTLRSRAEVLVDSHWLSALARAQKRMGFKHGTALLTSNELPSPISWGLMRPVILLNGRAVEASEEAEAIIAHELAHVARLDWIKLLLARIATALFWFNPWVWILAREAHQLREEAADDTVLAANIEDTEYARLLVGIARHECKGLLIGAHGVAPSKGSLARRVARVLDSRSPRGPVARSFAAGVFVGALAIATPLAALTLVPAGTKDQAMTAELASARDANGYYPAGGVPLPGVVSSSVNNAVSSAVQAVAASDPNWTDLTRDIEKEVAKSTEKALLDSRKVAAWSGVGPKPGSVGPKGRVGPAMSHDDAIDEAIALKAVGATPEYARQIRSAAPNLGPLSTDDLTSLKAVGVTPAYIAELARSGYRNLDAESLVELRALNVRGHYIKGMADAGYANLSSDTLVEMKAVGVTPAKVRQLRREGYPRLTPDQLVSLVAVGGASHRDDRDEDGDHDDDNDDDGG